MTIEYKLPDLGEDIETGDVIGVFVSAGDSISEEQPLMEIETDKAAIEIPAPAGGVIKEVHVNEGDTIKVGQLLVTIDDGKGIEKESEPKEVTQEEEKTEEEIIEEKAKKEVEIEMNADPEPSKEAKSEKETEENISEKIKREVKEEPASEKSEPLLGKAIPASPSIRRMARELGIDITQVIGSGLGGRISEEDVRNFAPGKSSKSKIEKTSAPAKKIDFSKWGEVKYTPMSKVRRLTAERLTEAWTAPHVTQYDRADITRIEELRKESGPKVAKTGGKLTMTSILVKVLASALAEFPQFNASVDMDSSEIVYKKYYNIGVAVDTDRGLLVPVIKDVNKKNLTELSVELSELSEKARNKKIAVDELQGGTFTISNLGGLGGTYFSPVINAPEVAILGISRSVTEPVYIDGGFLPRLMLPLSLSYDHRLIDGADAIRFLRWVIETLEKTTELEL